MGLFLLGEAFFFLLENQLLFFLVDCNHGLHAGGAEHGRFLGLFLGCQLLGQLLFGSVLGFLLLCCVGLQEPALPLPVLAQDHLVLGRDPLVALQTVAQGVHVVALSAQIDRSLGRFPGLLRLVIFSIGVCQPGMYRCVVWSFVGQLAKYIQRLPVEPPLQRQFTIQRPRPRVIRVVPQKLFQLGVGGLQTALLTLHQRQVEAVITLFRVLLQEASEHLLRGRWIPPLAGEQRPGYAAPQDRRGAP